VGGIAVEIDNSFARLIRPIERRMFDTIWRILRHSQDTEDALQIALATVWQERLRIESHPAPHAMILKICSDAAIDHFRKRRSHGDVATLKACLPSSRSPPLDDVIDRETLDTVMSAITRLSQNQATAVVMRFLHGETDATIAAALGCGTETVREHLARGRERLGRMLGQLAPPGWNSTGEVKTHLSQENEL
jgi:RNA polymerase sigma factor (sigma-70 family)